MLSSSASWALLFASVAAEVVGTLALRYADGFKRLWPSLIVTLSYAGAIWLMSLSVKRLDVGLAYAVWAGSGMALTAILGVAFLGESSSPLKFVGLALIVLGVIALNISSS